MFRKDALEPVASLDAEHRLFARAPARQADWKLRFSCRCVSSEKNELIDQVIKGRPKIVSDLPDID